MPGPSVSYSGHEVNFFASAVPKCMISKLDLPRGRYGWPSPATKVLHDSALFALQLLSQFLFAFFLSVSLSLASVRPDWAIIDLPKSLTFLGIFCKGVKIYHFSGEIIFGQLLQTFGNFFLVTLLRFDLLPSDFSSRMNFGPKNEMRNHQFGQKDSSVYFPYLSLFLNLFLYLLESELAIPDLV